MANWAKVYPIPKAVLYEIIVTDIYDGTERRWGPLVGRTYALQFAAEVGVSRNTITNVVDSNHLLVSHQPSQAVR